MDRIMPDNIEIAKKALDSIIKKSRVHLYKPIQIAEILYHARTQTTIDLSNIETYRTRSKKKKISNCRHF